MFYRAKFAQDFAQVANLVAHGSAVRGGLGYGYEAAAVLGRNDQSSVFAATLEAVVNDAGPSVQLVGEVPLCSVVHVKT